jgi:hypothetical protein
MAFPNDVDNGSILRVVQTNPATGAPSSSVTGAPPGTGITASTAAAAAASNATLAAVAGKITYITGFTVSGGGATLASIIAVTVTGTITGTLTYYLGVPAGVLVGASDLTVQFSTPVPASAPNTAIVVNVPSFGAGSTAQSAVATGFQL